MPSLGADMERGTLTEWLVKPGDYVHRGDTVAVIDTEKAAMDVESFEEGVVAELLVEPGTSVPVGGPLARITQTPADGAPMQPRATAPPAAPAPARAQLLVASPAPRLAASPPVRHFAHQHGLDADRLHGTGRRGRVTHADVERAVAGAGTVAVGPAPAAPRPAARDRVRSSPRARAIAAELGIDLAAVPGSGPGLAVLEVDVRRAIAAVPAQPGTVEPLRQPAHDAPVTPAARETAKRAAGLRRAVGSLMARSKKSIPHYYLSTTLDLRVALDWMRAVNAQRPVTARLVPAALLLKASALAARDIPEVNGFYTEGAFRPSPTVHLGVAVTLRQGGLVAPAIHDADTLALDVLMERLRDLVARARGGRLHRAEMTDATLTVTNLGDLGVESVFGVIYPPQVALVGFGRVVEQPFADQGLLGVRPAVTATLSADHRVSDGLRGGRFLARVGELLAQPGEL